MLSKLTIILFVSSCSLLSPSQQEVNSTTASPQSTKEFSRGELILGTELLAKIFDQEMAPLECVPDIDEASLLLRTIRPRMEVVEDDLQAMLDDPKEITTLIEQCEQNCTCEYIDELLREHQVKLDKKQQKAMLQKRSEKEINRCLNYVQSTFCKSDLFQTLDREKVDFSFEEGT